MTAREAERDVGVFEYRVAPPVSELSLNTLFSAARGHHRWRRFASMHRRSLVYLCAYYRNQVVGYVNVVWDGGTRGFLVDLTVHPEYRGRGIGTALVERAVEVANRRGVGSLRAEFGPDEVEFYRRLGFESVDAGVRRLEGVRRGS